jgi:hypothetical protein
MSEELYDLGEDQFEEAPIALDAPVAETAYDAKAAIEARDQQIAGLQGSIESLQQMVQDSQRPAETEAGKTLWDVTDTPIEDFKGDIARNATDIAVKVMSAKGKMLAEYDAATTNVPDDIRNEIRKAIEDADAPGTLIAMKRNEHRALAEMAIGRAVSQGHLPVTPVQRAETGTQRGPKVTAMASEEKEFFDMFAQMGVTEEQWSKAG